LDTWAVRRSVVQNCLSDRWGFVLDDSRRAQTEAMFLQFQEHVHSIQSGAADAGIAVAGQQFYFLPPIGWLPVKSAGSAKGFDTNVFFGSHASLDLATIDANRLRGLFDEAMDQDPIELGSVGKIQLYRVWENVVAVSKDPSTQAYIVFASPTLDYRGTARF